MTDQTTQMEVSASKLALDAKKGDKHEDGIYTLSTGYKVKITPVSASLIGDVVAGIKDPPVPVWKNPDKDNREEENYSNPDYINGKAEAEKKRNDAGVEVLIVFGVDLIDPLPEDKNWIKKLKVLSKKGLLNLGDYNLEDEEDLSFLFKKYIAISIEDIGLIMRVSGFNREDVDQATESFQRPA